jgi:hypothetical protein
VQIIFIRWKTNALRNFPPTARRIAKDVVFVEYATLAQIGSNVEQKDVEILKECNKYNKNHEIHHLQEQNIPDQIEYNLSSR